MRNWVWVAVLAGALAACDDAAEESDDVPAPEAPPAAEAASESMAGTWDTTMADGTVFTAVLDADGTYQDIDTDGAVMERGTWEERPDGTACFDSEGGNDTVVCFTIGEEQADGSIVVTPDNGTDKLTIRREN